MSDPSLRELFEQLVRDPTLRAEFSADQAGFFVERGFGDLDEPLMAEALTNVVSGFPPDVAEHFSDFTVAASPLPPGPDSVDVDVDVAGAFELLATAPGWPEGEDGSAQPDAPISDAIRTADAAADPTDEFGSGAGRVDQDSAGADVSDAAAGAADPLDDQLDGGVDPLDDQLDGGVDPLDELGAEASVEPISIEEDDPMGLDVADGLDADGDVIDG